jgi:hypothetical protein
MNANGIANNVVVDGKYITQAEVHWNGTVRGYRRGVSTELI